MNIDLKIIKKAYFLGIGGIGVSAIARMFSLEGKEVSGSDLSGSEVIDELKRLGINVHIGNDINNIPDDVDVVIYSIAIPHFAKDFFESVKNKFKNVISYPEALSIISKDKYTIAIAGTHGKTTTVAMVAKILIDAGFDPTVIVGSILKDSKTNFIAGKSKYLVVEACEYCRSFMEINPNIIGVTTIDNDHMDYYKDESDIVSAFSDFVKKLPQDGMFVGDLSNNLIKKVSNIEDIRIIDSLNYFDHNLKLKIPGEHNRKNAFIALSIADCLGIDKSLAIESIKNFSGTWRRFEFIGKTEKGAIVYDDYAHHPTEIRATISGAREMFPDKKITVVFQPHLYSRTKILFDDFVKELSKSDSVIVAPIYGSREIFDNTISSKMLVDEISKLNKDVSFVEKIEDIAEDLRNFKDEKDIIITMGAGDIYKVNDYLTK